MLQHYRAAIALRHEHSALARGALSGMEQMGDVVRFHRHDGVEEVFCAFNLGYGFAEFVMVQGDWRETGQGVGGVSIDHDGLVRLGPWQYCLAKQTAKSGVHGSKQNNKSGGETPWPI